MIVWFPSHAIFSGSMINITRMVWEWLPEYHGNHSQNILVNTYHIIVGISSETWFAKFIWQMAGKNIIFLSQFQIQNIFYGEKKLSICQQCQN